MTRVGQNHEPAVPSQRGHGDPAGYPRDLERDVALRDGARVHIRPIRPADAPRLVTAYERLSAQSAYQRFFSAMRRLPPDWARFLATVDYRTRLALIAEQRADRMTGASTAEAEAELLGVARYEPSADGIPEVAFVIIDAWQNRGLGTALFHALLEAGAARGYRRFRAWVLADNARMLDLLHRHGNVEQTLRDGAVLELIFTPGPAAQG